MSKLRKKTMRRFNLFICALLLLMLPACGQAARVMSVSEVWARPGLAGGNSAVYFTIENGTGKDDTLLEAATEAGKFVEIHLSMMDENDQMQMVQQESLPVPAGEKVEFKPGGYHVMLIDLPADLKAGDTFPMTLKFDRAGEIPVDVEVKEP
jgi:copper(I)-binding protein